MSAIPKLLLTPQEYLARERAADFKSEYFRGEVFAMAGTTIEHTYIKDNFARALGNQFKGLGCRALTSDMRVKIDPTGLYTYPDIVVICESPRLEDDHFDTLLNPQIIIEVLSDSTEAYDRGRKFDQYRQIESLREYVLVSHRQPMVQRYVRQPVQWAPATFEGLSGIFEFATVAAKVPLAEIYSGVTFTEKRAQS